jgi:thiol-disulfide isomerase/thioredoxin
MKKYFSLILFGTIVACTHPNKDMTFSEVSTLPSFNLVLIDSSTIFNTRDISAGKPVILIYFSPDCEDCQAQIRSLLKNIDFLKNSKIVLLTPMPFNELKRFYISFQLTNFKNITVGEDYEYAFGKLFKPTRFPFTAIYNGQKQLVKLYSGIIHITQIVKAIQS